MIGITRILVPTDFSPTSDVALNYAKQLAGQFAASLHLVHAFDDPFTTAAFASQAYTAIPLPLREQLISENEARLAERLTPDERVRFTGTTEGRFKFECNRMCGAGHHFMRGEIVVETKGK